MDPAKKTAPEGAAKLGQMVIGHACDAAGENGGTRPPIFRFCTEDSPARRRFYPRVASGESSRVVLRLTRPGWPAFPKRGMRPGRLGRDCGPRGKPVASSDWSETNRAPENPFDYGMLNGVRRVLPVPLIAPDLAIVLRLGGSPCLSRHILCVPSFDSRCKYLSGKDTVVFHSRVPPCPGRWHLKKERKTTSCGPRSLLVRDINWISW